MNQITEDVFDDMPGNPDERRKSVILERVRIGAVVERFMRNAPECWVIEIPHANPEFHGANYAVCVEELAPDMEENPNCKRFEGETPAECFEKIDAWMNEQGWDNA